MARCFVTRKLPFPAIGRLAARHELDVWPERLPPSYDELREMTRQAEGLLCLLTDRIDEDLLKNSPNLEAISNYAVGCDNIDLDAAGRRGIPVGHTPDVLTEATADLAFALLLAAARKIPQAQTALHEGDWVTFEPAAFLGREVHGKTLGIVGLGRIGRAVARRTRGFDMTVVHTGPPSRVGSSGNPGVSLEELLEESDFVSLHCPLTAATRHLIDAAALGRMRTTAILINTARGPIVDQRALKAALESNSIAGAALDVTDPEPLPKGDPLSQAPNLLITPHIGSATQAARERMADLAVDNLLAALNGEPMPHQANKTCA